MINKKGAEKVLSVYWFAIIVLVATGIFIMVYNFYNYPYDVREIEANILLNNVADCVSRGGIINSEIFSGNFENDFFSICRLNFSAEETFEETQYYVSLNLSNASLIILDFEKGNKNLISSCGLEKDVEKNNLAKCVQREFYSVGSNSQSYLIKILTIVRKTEKNVN